MRKEDIIDIKYGNITEEDKEEAVIITGSYLHEDSNYAERLRILIKQGEEEIINYPINISGYNISVNLGRFSKENCDDILICGDSGGSEGYSLAILYGYKNGRLTELFNGESFSEQYKCDSKYLEGNKVQVDCPALERRYMFDIGAIKKDELRNIFNSDGKIITNTDPTVSYINKVELVGDLETGKTKLQLFQNVLGKTRNSVLGKICTCVEVGDETKVNTQYALVNGENISEMFRASNRKDEILSMLPDDAMIINFNKFGGNNGLIYTDIDGDGIEEILCGYKSKENQYLSMFREVDGRLNHIDTILGEGYDISDLVISKLKPKGGQNILVGWRIGSIWSVLDILEFKNNKFSKLLTGDKINYSKLELVEFDNKRSGISDIALWSHETGEAYRVQLYSFRGEVLEKTNKYDREYFSKVVDYYRQLIDRTRETPQYLYFLIDAQYRCGKKKEALINLNKAIKHPNPYPSLDELRRLRKKISG